MFEYGAVIHVNFIESFHNGLDSLSRWFSDIPIHWHLLAFVIFILLLKVLTATRHNKK